jgi:hypothetical protein
MGSAGAATPGGVPVPGTPVVRRSDGASKNRNCRGLWSTRSLARALDAATAMKEEPFWTAAEAAG